MPLGIVSQEEFLKELDKSNTKKPEDKYEPGPCAAIIIPKAEIGRPPDCPNTPEVIRNIVGEEAIRGASVSSLMSEFAMSQSSVSAYKNGSTSTRTYEKKDENLVKHLNGVKDKIKKRATNRLMMALDEITPDKLKDVKVTEASQVAKDMASIVKQMEPENESNGDSKTQFVVFAPQMRVEQDFHVVKIR